MKATDKPKLIDEDEINFFDSAAGVRYFKKLKGIQNKKRFVGSVFLRLTSLENTAVVDFVIFDYDAFVSGEVGIFAEIVVSESADRSGGVGDSRVCRAAQTDRVDGIVSDGDVFHPASLGPVSVTCSD